MSIPVSDLLRDFSVEITGKDIDALRDCSSLLPVGTLVNITFLGNETLALRTAAARAVKGHGLIPVPHIAARRMRSAHELDDFLTALRSDGTAQVFAVGGDPPEPLGPYTDSVELVGSPQFADHGVETVSISGYPEGHPHIPTDKLWAAIEAKIAALAERPRAGDIITQFTFAVDPVVDWIEEARGRGIAMPIRIGVPGPCGVKRLLAYARRFGVSSGAGIAKKYGFSLANLFSTAGPDKFISELAGRITPERHGIVKVHFYTFGGLAATAGWVRDFSAQHGPPLAVSGHS